MFNWFKGIKRDFQEAREQTAIDRRNAERRELCAEYARNKARQGAIIARLAELSGEANKEAAAARIGWELEDIDRRTMADVLRRAPEPAQTVSHFMEDVKHFRADYCPTYAPPAKVKA